MKFPLCQHIFAVSLRQNVIIWGKEKNLMNALVRNVERYLCRFGFQLLPAIKIKGVVAFCPTFLQEFLATTTFLMNPRVPAQGSVSWSVSQHPTCWPVSPDLKREQQEGQALLQLQLRKNPCTISYLLGITFLLSRSSFPLNLALIFLFLSPTCPWDRVCMCHWQW